LRCRDFTINAIALSLNQASLGLLLDPDNGLADLEHKELRAVYGRALYDDPRRLLRLIRFRVRFGFTIEPRTQQQYENARLEELEKRITGRRLFEEFIEIAGEANPGEVLHALEEEELLSLFSPALTGGKLNMAGFSRLLKARQLIPFGVDLPINGLALFLHLLTEKLTPKENALLATTIEMHKAESDLAPKLAARAKQIEKEAKSTKLKKPSQVYGVLSKAAGEELIFLYLTSEFRLVQDRIRNYLQKYLPAAQEITDRQVAATDLEPGTPKFRKRKEEMILARVDVRAKKAPTPPPETAPAPQPEPTRPPGRFPGRASHMRGR
jgi:tRNA nucleotidyltransferase/poly(A) polymerase